MHQTVRQEQWATSDKKENKKKFSTPRINPTVPEEKGEELDDEQIEAIRPMVEQFGDEIIYDMFRFFCKHNVSLASGIDIIRASKVDVENRSRTDIQKWRENHI